MGIKNVQIPFTLFRQLVSYHLLDDYSCSDEICKGLEEKMDHLVNRQLYTQSKTAATEEEREKARKEYLDKKGIQENFRWYKNVYPQHVKVNIRSNRNNGRIID